MNDVKNQMILLGSCYFLEDYLNLSECDNMNERMMKMKWKKMNYEEKEQVEVQHHRMNVTDVGRFDEDLHRLQVVHGFVDPIQKKIVFFILQEYMEIVIKSR